MQFLRGLGKVNGDATTCIFHSFDYCISATFVVIFANFISKMEYKGPILIEFEGRIIFIHYTVFYFRNSYYMDVTDKHGEKHRFKWVENEWNYSSLKPLKWRYDFTVKLFKAMDTVLKELGLLH